MPSESSGTHDQNTSPEKLTNERHNTHGDWTQQSRLAYELKNLLRQHHHVDLTPGQMEALDMIAVKISRILTGNPNEPDHWDDIAGYAFLGKGGHKKA